MNDNTSLEKSNLGGFKCPWCDKVVEYRFQLWNHYEVCPKRGQFKGELLK